MPKSPRQPNPITAAARRSKAARRVGVGSACACGENRPRALIPGSNPMICAKFKRFKEGRSVYDNHHVAGKANHPLTIPIPVNDHRAILSERQLAWPNKTLENPDGSPLIAIAACIRGFIDTVVYLLESLMLWGAQLLERLDEFLILHLGQNWWSSPEYTQFINGDR
jgi:hypothetical protein